MKKTVSIIVLWCGCGIFNFGAVFADIQGTFPLASELRKATDQRFAFIVAVMGPFATPVTLSASHVLEHGWRLD